MIKQKTSYFNLQPCFLKLETIALESQNSKLREPNYWDYVLLGFYNCRDFELPEFWDHCQEF